MEVYSVQTFREAVPEFECRESIIAQNSRCGLASLAEIEYENRDALIENRDALIENRDALIENRDALIENRDVVIANRVSILDSILDSCRDRESSVNLLLNGTVYKGGGDCEILPDQLELNIDCKGELKTCPKCCVPCSLDDTLQHQTWYSKS